MQDRLAPSVGGRVGQQRPGRCGDAVPALGSHLGMLCPPSGHTHVVRPTYGAGKLVRHSTGLCWPGSVGSVIGVLGLRLGWGR